MKQSKVLIIASFLLMGFTLPLMAQKTRDLPGDEIKKKQADVAQEFLRGVNSLLDYLVTKSANDFEVSHSSFLSTDSLITLLEQQGKSKLDSIYLPKIKKHAISLKDYSLAIMRTMENQGEKSEFSFGDRTAILSRDGEAPLVTYLFIIKSYGENLLSDMTNVFFSYTWEVSGGIFEMRACNYGSWQKKFNEIGLGQKYMVVVINMTNKLGRDVTINPMTDKFIILTNKGRQYLNSDPDFDDHIALRNLPEEDQQSIFTDVMTIYDGADTPIIVLFPASARSADTWSRIIFDSAVGTMGESLPKGSLTKH